ncbi:glutathione S-transferase family protein [Alsobacter sp. R-9]
MTDTVTLFHAPNTRSSGARTLLEELGVPYDLHVLDMKAGEQRGADFLAVNPVGKVPAVRHGDAVVTEQVAVYIYLADLYPQAGLAPAVGDPLRGPYLRWIAMYGSSFEPAVIDRSLKREPTPSQMSVYGDFDTLLGVIVKQLSAGPWLFGDRFTAADVLWGSALSWLTAFRAIPEHPAIAAYVERFSARPAVQKVRAMDKELAAAQEAKAAARG